MAMRLINIKSFVVFVLNPITVFILILNPSWNTLDTPVSLTVYYVPVGFYE